MQWAVQNVPADTDNEDNNGNDDWVLPLSGGSTSEGLWKAGPCTPRPPPPSPIPLPQAAPGFWPHLPHLVTPMTPPGQRTTHYQAITQHNEVEGAPGSRWTQQSSSSAICMPVAFCSHTRSKRSAQEPNFPVGHTLHGWGHVFSSLGPLSGP